MLIHTLKDLLTRVKVPEKEITGLTLEFNKRIMDEILEASDQHCLAAYLGLVISKRTLGKNSEEKENKKLKKQ